MELSYINRARIAAVMAIGVLVLGFWAYPLVRPAAPVSVMSFYSGSINLMDVILCSLVSLAVGFVSYFAAWPYGGRIGILAVPAGLAVWTLRSDTMFALMRIKENASERYGVYQSMKFEGFFWLFLVFMGFLGVWLGARAVRQKPHRDIEDDKLNLEKSRAGHTAAGVFVSVLLGMFVTGLFAQDVKMHDAELGSVIGQPAAVQIGLAVIVGFAASAFAAKIFLGVHYIVPAVCTAITAWFSIEFFVKKDVLQYLYENWAPVFYARSINAIMPIQFVCFGVIGSVLGYWLGIQYMHWRKMSAQQADEKGK